MRYERLLIIGFILILFLVFNNYNNMQSIYLDYSVVDLAYNNSPNQIFIDGPVIKIFNDGFLMHDEQYGNFFLVKTNSDVKLGDFVYLLGTLNSHNKTLNSYNGIYNEIIPNKILITKGYEINYVFLWSLLGFIIFLLIFLRYWKFNFKRLLFVRRK